MASFPEDPLSTLSLSTQSSARAEEPRLPLTLTTLPNELQIQIFSLACKYESVIEPQFRNGYNNSQGFIHSGDNRYTSSSSSFECLKDAEDRARDTNLVLTAMSLALTCKSINALVHGDLLFYKVNSFGFQDTRVLIDFMRGIKLEKAKAIRSIKFESCGWPAGFEFRPLPTELWENVRNLELRIVVYCKGGKLCYSNILMGLPYQCYRNLDSVTILYWTALRHKFSWHLIRTKTEASYDTSLPVQEFRKILGDDFEMTNVDQLVTEIISHVTDQWDGACKVDTEYTEYPMPRFGVIF